MCDHFDVYILKVSSFSVHITSRRCEVIPVYGTVHFSRISQTSAISNMISLSYGTKSSGFKDDFSQGIMNFET